MPTYQYACTACEHRFEAVQSFSDSSLTECPECSGKLRKLFGAVGVVFKGSGFYRTDSRSGSSTSAATTTSSSDAKPAEKKSSDTKSSSDSKSSTSAPAAAAS
ncbi:FmdB family zinc ribbon protein [Lentzea californiensis]|uniref:FmdB family zinc ribbon protein n=1 Tax=Lentzea californiensis TaxID=438851 RepID=UPI002164B2FB|nr:FmdB family zinc ribbon protein [Lentzea californiensis]MCR3747767.1 putative regulatory protein, FmdB family [Lentzea californiensis]